MSSAIIRDSRTCDFSDIYNPRFWGDFETVSKRLEWVLINVASGRDRRELLRNFLFCRRYSVHVENPCDTSQDALYAFLVFPAFVLFYSSLNTYVESTLPTRVHTVKKIVRTSARNEQRISDEMENYMFTKSQRK